MAKKVNKQMLEMQMSIYQSVKESFLAAANAIIDHQVADHSSSEHDTEVMEQVREALNYGLAGLEPDVSDGNWGLPPEKWTGPEDYEAASHGE